MNIDNYNGNPKNVIVMIGAGASTSAGIPDFRSPKTGLYHNLEKYNLPNAEAIFEINYFKKNQEPFYNLAKDIWPSNYKPTPVHHFIKELDNRGILLRCYTQNIDSLEHLAGLDVSKIVAAHGNFDSASIIGSKVKVPIKEVEEAIRSNNMKFLNEKYGGIIKPDIVFYGERLPEKFYIQSSIDFPKCDLLIIIGTSLTVHPFCDLINKVNYNVPRILINNESNSRLRTNRDFLYLGDCNEGVEYLKKMFQKK